MNAQRGMYEVWEIDQQGEWERKRWLAAIIINPHVKKNIQPKDLVKFPWEKQRRKKVSTEQVYKEAQLFKKIVEHKKKVKNG